MPPIYDNIGRLVQGGGSDLAGGVRGCGQVIHFSFIIF